MYSFNFKQWSPLKGDDMCNYDHDIQLRDVIRLINRTSETYIDEGHDRDTIEHFAMRLIDELKIYAG